MSKSIFDRRGIPICVGDVLKIHHFTAALRRKKIYMYKWVIEKIVSNSGCEMLIINHLNQTSFDYRNGYCMVCDDKIHPAIEIVQGWGPIEHLSFEERKRYGIDPH